MGQTRLYQSLEEKHVYLSPLPKDGVEYLITKKEDVDDLIKIFENRTDYVFRGMYNSRFKLYTSSQRFWINNELHLRGFEYMDFIRSVLKLTREENRSSISNFLKKVSGYDDDLALLGFIQHYGGPTPLIDFTKDLRTALYFACQGSSTPIGSNDQIDNYVSLYIVSLTAKNEKGEIDTFWDKPWKSLEKAKVSLTEDDRLKINEGVRKIDVFMNKSLPFTVTYVDDDIMKSFDHKGINNMNILNQKGVFFFVNNATTPFEELVEKEFGIGYNPNTKIKFIQCVHIHKNLIPYTLRRINIDENYIFPNSYDMVKNISKNVLL